MKSLSGICACALLCTGSVSASAESELWAGFEYLHWQEQTTPKVTEKGSLAAFGFNWTQEKAAGLLLAYRGKLYLGTVKYEGSLLFSPNTPVTSSTAYTGMEHEAQIRWRTAKPDYNVDPFLGVGVNTWKRELSSIQKEVYTVLYARAGVEFEHVLPTGMSGALGVRLPLNIDENAYFNDLGYDNNPHLKPKGQPTAFAHIGYRFNKELEVTGYFESIKFDDSDPVTVNFNGTTFGQFYQPGSTMNIFGLRLEYRFPVN